MSDAKLRRNHTPGFKAKVALDAIRGMETMAQIASLHGVHTTQIERWKRVALTALPQAFEAKASERGANKEALIAALYQQIGQLKVELDWLGKKVR